MADQGVKNNSNRPRNGLVLHTWQRAEILIKLRFFAFAKIFQQTLDTSSCGDL